MTFKSPSCVGAQASLTGLCTSGDVPALGPVTTTSTTLRLTQHYQDDDNDTVPLSELTRMNLCGHQVSPRNEQERFQVSAPLRHLENIFLRITGVSGQQVLDVLALEDDVLSAVSLSAAGTHSATEVQQEQVWSLPARPRRDCWSAAPQCHLLFAITGFDPRVVVRN